MESLDIAVETSFASSRCGTSKIYLKIEVAKSGPAQIRGQARNSTSKTLFAQKIDEVADAARVSPLVVVPRDHLDAIAGDDACQVGVHDRRPAVALKVRR